MAMALRGVNIVNIAESHCVSAPQVTAMLSNVVGPVEEVTFMGIFAILWLYHAILCQSLKSFLAKNCVRSW